MGILPGPMAMEQSEERNIHPFFRKDAPANIPNGTAIHEPQPSVKTESYAGNNLSHSTNSLQYGSHQNPPATLEQDPNSERRKRRKTDKSNNKGQAGSIANFIVGKQINGTSESENTLMKGTPSSDHGQPASVSEPPVDPALEGLTFIVQDNPDSQEQSEQQSSTCIAHTSVDSGTANELTQRRSSRQKTVKLFPNGKLLSSPGPEQIDETPKRRVSKRGKTNGQKDGGKRRLLVVKYGTDGEARQRLGALIDEIIGGRRKHGAPSVVPAPTSAPKKQLPPKPTHPFFMKKATKPDTPPIPLSDHSSGQGATAATESPASTPASNGSNPGRKPANAYPTPFTSFRPKPKSPEPVQPIWPPQDLTHIRGIDAEPLRTQFSLDLHLKKAKMAAVCIHNKENVLSPEVQGYDHDTEPILRIPGRAIASGAILQKAVTKELSPPSLSKPNENSLSSTCHPAIRKLHSSLKISMTAFDRGQYDSLLWAHKYAPNTSDDVLQPTREASMLRDWLKYLMVSAVDTGKISKDAEKAKRKSDEKKRKKRKKSDKLDGFIISSEDEAFELGEISGSDDELAGDVTIPTKKSVIRPADLASGPSKSGTDKSRVSNAILLSGPSGCGKTASVYAVAKELDFEVFEITPGNRRSAKDILDRVGDMTRNHLVQHVGSGEQRSNSQTPDTEPQSLASEDTKQNKLAGFFKSVPAKAPKKKAKSPEKEPEKESDQKRSRHQKQSLILLEEADVLFDEDRQFWSGVLSLIQQSKRPIVITCNDESLIPLGDVSFHAILRYRAPPQHLVVDYLLLLTANEGHMVKREAIDDLYTATGKDLRRSIMELDFWCQMAVGSEKSGLDWLVDRWPPGVDLDHDGHPVRVLSLNTYERFMGWFSRDMMMSNSLDRLVEPQQESLDWWQLSLQDSEWLAGLGKHSSYTPSPQSNQERLEQLRHQDDLFEMRSVLDILGSDCSLDHRMDPVDTFMPQLSEKQRTNYIEGHQLLSADLTPDYSLLSKAIGGTFGVLLEKISRPQHEMDVETSQSTKVLANITRAKATGPTSADFLRAFEPVMRADYAFPIPTGRLAPSFENGIGPIVEDLAPYIRAIMAFDLRLEHHRLQLSGLLSQQGQGTKRVRKTRASRAALEGGSKSETRKERWFPPDTNPGPLLATGKKEWQDLLVQKGYLTVSSVEEAGRETSEPVVESSSEGGI
ncbi:P-loop containing nucleoside triphosphate hydrolase protein [Aspergillus steynii IBT 23096]|uniref:P-loop containing nucleoside triphosphate hydrolase protein n=1 Tax=Aspergillus steynii IBT 23096 TaxID=1392250 RepID=A0A2I2GEF7_9EURO|nr:P-loop containing nucleoside triphosphate hydrolase protein [Aspergillus steynii IBT 23096]PLB51264.1 P-loop containing nucleoside triphosphate hydrolase protein [Aspergillus steynii IBT 23096]